MEEDTKKPAEPKPAKAPTVEEYYRALHVADAASDLVAVIIKKGARNLPQEAFEELCVALQSLRVGLPPCPEDTEDPIHWRMLDIEHYFPDENEELVSAGQ